MFRSYLLSGLVAVVGLNCWPMEVAVAQHHHHHAHGAAHHHHHGHFSHAPAFGFSVGWPRYSYGYSSYQTYRWPTTVSYSYRSCFQPVYSCAPVVNWSSYYSGYCSPYSSYYSPAYSISIFDRFSAIAPRVPAGGAFEVDARPLAAVVRNVANVALPLVARNEEIELRRVTNKAAGPDNSHALSQNYLSAGDKLFAAGRHHEALNEYKRATAFSSDEAQGYFRQGIALVATKRYQESVQAFRHGLAADADYVNRHVRLDEVYGERSSEKLAHFEALAAAALENPRDASLLFATGVLLHLDGQSARAQKFLSRAGSLSPVEERYVQAFQTKQPAAALAERPVVGERDL